MLYGFAVSREASLVRAHVRRLALARLISQVGTQAAYVALLALVFERSGGSGVWVAAALLSALGARVVVSPFAGALGDYSDRRVVMVCSDLAAAAAFVLISQTHALWILVVLAGVASVAEAPFAPASNAMLTMLVPSERRGWANGTLAAGASMGIFAGGIAGGLLVASFGAASAFLVNAGSFVASAALVFSVRGKFRVAAEDLAEHRGLLRGMWTVFGHRGLRTTTSTFALGALALGMMNVAEFPFFVHIGAGSAGFGVAVASWAAGQVTAARLASRLASARVERLTLIGGWALSALAVGLSGALPLFGVAACAFILGGLGNTLGGISAVLLIQRWAPPQVQSRAIAAFDAIANTGLGISLVVGGVLLAPLGPRGVFLLAGALGALAAATGILIPPDGRGPIRTAPERATSPDEPGHRPTKYLTPAFTPLNI